MWKKISVPFLKPQATVNKFQLRLKVIVILISLVSEAQKFMAQQFYKTKHLRRSWTSQQILTCKLKSKMNKKHQRSSEIVETIIRDKTYNFRNAFYGKFATFSDFWKKIFLANISGFFSKNPNFERFEKSYYFSRILRQICKNLMKKIVIQTREEPMLACLREINWQTSGKKTHLLERKTLLSIFSIWRNIIS